MPIDFMRKGRGSGDLSRRAWVDRVVAKASEPHRPAPTGVTQSRDEWLTALIRASIERPIAKAQTHEEVLEHTTQVEQLSAVEDVAEEHEAKQQGAVGSYRQTRHEEEKPKQRYMGREE